MWGLPRNGGCPVWRLGWLIDGEASPRNAYFVWHVVNEGKGVVDTSSAYLF